MSIERKTYERGISECAECHCRRRESGMESVTIDAGAQGARVLWRCRDREFCAEVLADKRRRERAEVSS